MRKAVAALALALLVPAVAAADPTPIPQSDTDTQYVGNPATPNPIASPDPPRHPHMAPNGRSNLHEDAWQTDTSRWNLRPVGLGGPARTAGRCPFVNVG